MFDVSASKLFYVFLKLESITAYSPKRYAVNTLQKNFFLHIKQFLHDFKIIIFPLFFEWKFRNDWHAKSVWEDNSNVYRKAAPGQSEKQRHFEGSQGKTQKILFFEFSESFISGQIFITHVSKRKNFLKSFVIDFHINPHPRIQYWDNDFLRIQKPTQKSPVLFVSDFT